MFKETNINPSPELFKAIAEFQKDLKQPNKNKEGHFGSYADLSAIAKAITETGASHGLGFLQEDITDIDNNGRRMSQVITHIVHESGEFVTLQGLPVDIGTTPQQTLSNNTYARRGSLATAFGVVADEDDDGEQITALVAEQNRQENMRKAMLAKLKEKLKQVPKVKEEQVYATVGLSSAKATGSRLEKLDMNKISMLAGAAIFATNDAED